MQNKIKYKVIVDTREKNIEHILKVFEKHNIAYKKEKLDFGDYAIESIKR